MATSGYSASRNNDTNAANNDTRCLALSHHNRWRLTASPGAALTCPIVPNSAGFLLCFSNRTRLRSASEKALDDVPHRGMVAENRTPEKG